MFNMKSPRTTIGGLSTILFGVAGVLKSYHEGGLIAALTDTLAIGQILTGIALMMARDNATSDQQAGVRPEPEVRRAEPVNKTGIHGGRPNS